MNLAAPEPGLGRTLWQHRALLGALVRREVQNRYAGSAWGLLWALLQPLMMLGIYALVFVYVFRVQLPQAHPDQPYVLWVALTLWPWLAFQEGTLRGASAVIAHANLVKKVAFPHELLVYGAVVSTLALHAVGYTVVLGVLKLAGLGVSWHVIPAALWAWAVLGMAALALGLALAAIQVFVRDMEHISSQLFTLLFYASPVLYPMALVPPSLTQAMALNPLSYVLEATRNAGLGGGLTTWPLMLGSLVVAAILWILGRALFNRLAPHFEDML